MVTSIALFTNIIGITFRALISIDTGRKLNVHKTFRRRPGRLLNVLCTFSLRSVSTGMSRGHTNKAKIFLKYYLF